MKNKPGKTSAMSIAAILLIIAVLASTTATYAWFTISTRTKLASMELYAKSGPQLRFDTVHHYDEAGNIDIYSYRTVLTQSDIDAQMLETFSFTIGDVRLAPLTSGDGKTLYLREPNENGGEPTVPQNEEYLEFIFYFVSDEDMWVHLSSARSQSGEDGTSLKAISLGERANIVKAVRISFESEHNTAIYEPSKDGKTVLTGQAAKVAIPTFDLPSPDEMVYTNETRLFHITAGEEVAVTVRVWAEGDDPDCVDSVSSGIFDLRLKFVGTDDDNREITKRQSGDDVRSDSGETPES